MTDRIRIALDCDGVIFDFNGHCEDRFGAHPHHLTFTHEDGVILKGDAALWSHVNGCPDFWLDMPKFEHADELVEMARPYGVQFLTGCPVNGYDRADAEKRIKLAKLWPGIPVITCRSKDKPIYMQQPGDILVDDFVRNIKKWTAAGGVAIHFKTFEQAARDLTYALSAFEKGA